MTHRCSRRLVFVGLCRSLYRQRCAGCLPQLGLQLCFDEHGLRRVLLGHVLKLGFQLFHVGCVRVFLRLWKKYKKKKKKDVAQRLVMVMMCFRLT